MRIVTILLLVALAFGSSGCVLVDYQTTARISLGESLPIQDIDSSYPRIKPTPKKEYIYVEVPQKPKTVFANFNN